MSDILQELRTHSWLWNFLQTTTVTDHIHDLKPQDMEFPIQTSTPNTVRVDSMNAGPGGQGGPQAFLQEDGTNKRENGA